MILVLFEVKLYKNTRTDYLAIAKSLSGELKKQQGFIALERFANIEDENKMLSVQLWKNEQSILQWKDNIKHRSVMPIGQKKII